MFNDNLHENMCMNFPQTFAKQSVAIAFPFLQESPTSKPSMYARSIALIVTSLAKDLHSGCVQSDKVEEFQELIYRKTEKASRKV